MSYLGLHIASANRPRFGEYLRLSPDSPLSCVVAIDQNVHAEVKQFSPSTVTLWRTQHNPAAGRDGGDNPPSFMDVPLEKQAALSQNWMNGLKPLWDKNKHDVLIVNNEQDIGTLDHGYKLNAFFLECMRIAETWGTRIGIASYSTGNPSDDSGLTMEQRYETMLPALNQAANNGHYLILHAHIHEQKDHFADTGFRHERAIRFFQSRGIQALRPWIVLGEWSNGVGGVEDNLSDYMDNVKAWDTYALTSPYSPQLVGAALYGFNQAETLYQATDALLNWIRLNPGRVIVKPPLAQTVVTITPGRKVTVRTMPLISDVTIYTPSDVKVEVK